MIDFNYLAVCRYFNTQSGTCRLNCNKFMNFNKKKTNIKCKIKTGNEGLSFAFS